MAAVGLFTLNTSELNQGVLGGPGTGFTEGSRTRSATATGAPGFAGSTTNSTSILGTASGVAGFAGSASASRTVTGSATGSPGLTGNSTRATSVTATAAGSPQLTGAASNASASQSEATGSPALGGTATDAASRAASATGAPSLFGEASATRTRSASASGTPDTPSAPPTPPTPEPQAAGGGPRLFYPQRKSKVERPRETHLAGAAYGYLRARGRVTGTVGRSGGAISSNVVTGRCVGVRWPDDREIAQRKRRAQELELLIVLET